MNKIGCWNTWGLNSPKKQFAIRNWTLNSMLGIIGLLETKITPTNLPTVTASINLPAWKFLSNASTASPTCRILVGWDPSMFNLSCLQFSD